MTKLQMLAYVYSILSAFYGQPLQPAYRVKRLSVYAVERIYNVAKLNAKFEDPLAEQVQLIESHIAWEDEIFTCSMKG